MRREVVTIGDLTSSRLTKRYRRGRAASISATNPNFHAPSPAQMAAAPPSQALSAASVALLDYLLASGVPSMHDDDPQVLAFQQAYNADPVAALTGHLDDDGGYGNNTHDVLDVMTGQAPAVNTGSSVVPPAPSPPSSGIVPASTTGEEGSMLVPILLALAAGGLVVWLMKRKKKSGEHHRAPLLEVRTNPRRRRRGALL